jgi:hypothetical protein
MEGGMEGWREGCRDGGRDYASIRIVRAAVILIKSNKTIKCTGGHIRGRSSRQQPHICDSELAVEQPAPLCRRRSSRRFGPLVRKKAEQLR